MNFRGKVPFEHTALLGGHCGRCYELYKLEIV